MMTRFGKRKVWFSTALQLMLASLVGQGCGPDKMESTYVLDGHSVAVAVDRAGGRSINVTRGNSEVVVQVSVTRPGTASTIVSITGPLNEDFCLTEFRGGVVNSKALAAVQFRRSIEDCADGGRKELRQWWHSNNFLIYSEDLSYAPSGRIMKTVCKGPHGYELRN